MMSEIKRVLKDDELLVITVASSAWKIIQMIFYYPYLLLYYLTTPGIYGIKGKPTEKSVAKTVGQKGLNFLLPPVHGQYKDHAEEFRGYKLNRWRQLLEGNGLEINKVIRLPLYTPYGFGFGFVGRFAEKFGFCSSWAFILSKK